MKYVVECTPDEALVHALLSDQRPDVMHRSGKPEVLKFVKRTEQTVGLIDEDPDSNQPPMINELVEIEQISHLGLGRSQFSPNRTILTLSPRLEEWIMAACRETSTDIVRYNLPRDPQAFHTVVNSRITNFVGLLSDLRNRSNRLQTLSMWLRQS